MTPNPTPTPHAVKSIALFESLPVMFGVILFMLSNTTSSISSATGINDFGVAITLLGIAFGVYKNRMVK